MATAGLRAVVFKAMLLGELASSASTAGSYDGIQTANFTYNVVIINADNALNPNAKMCLIYTTIQPYFNYENSKQTLTASIIERGDYVAIRSWGRRNMGDIPTSPSCAGKVCSEFS